MFCLPLRTDIPSLLLSWAVLTAVADACTLQSGSIDIMDSTPNGTIVMPVIVASPDTLDIVETKSDSQNTILPLEVLSNNSLLLKLPITTTGVLRVTCGDGTKQILIVNMIDTDNNAPVWEKWNYTLSVRETQPVPFELPLYPKATDEADKNSGQQLVYKILPSDYSGHFMSSNPLQSVMNMSLMKQLDYETVQQVVLTLQVSDFNSTGQLVFVVNTTLTVNIINEDDESPVWLNCTSGAPIGVCYVRQLFSNSSTGTLISPPIKAVDGDLGLNAVIFYSILSQSPSNILSVENATGALTLITNLPVPETYSILLFATQVNNANRRTNTELRLNIVAASYAPPVFDKTVYNVTIIENNPSNGLVVVVKATDQLRKGVTYHLQAFSDVFSIDASTGELRAIKSLDFETKSSYTFNVTASDGTGSGFTTVIVQVGNENEFNPVFNSTEYSFAAVKRENGLEVGRVSATDGDGEPVTYYITDANFRKLFAVDANLGILTINTVPANLAEQSYRFSVTASDGSRTGSATVIVNFDSALINVSNASVSTIPLIVNFDSTVPADNFEKSPYGLAAIIIACCSAVCAILLVILIVLLCRRAAAKARKSFRPKENPAAGTGQGNSDYVYDYPTDGADALSTTYDNIDTVSEDHKATDVSSFRWVRS